MKVFNTTGNFRGLFSYKRHGNGNSVSNVSKNEREFVV